jgi:Family of unknown function (DUF6636)
MPRPTPTLLALLLTLAAAIATPAALASGGAPSAHAARITFFRTPSNLIGCMYMSRPAELRCDTRYRTRFSRGHHHCGQGDVGQSFRLERTGRVRVPCTSDAAFDPSARVLPYGDVRAFGPFECTSLKTGLDCTNVSHHGWLLSRQRQKLY